MTEQTNQIVRPYAGIKLSRPCGCDVPADVACPHRQSWSSTPFAPEDAAARGAAWSDSMSTVLHVMGDEVRGLREQLETWTARAMEAEANAGAERAERIRMAERAVEAQEAVTRAVNARTEMSALLADRDAEVRALNRTLANSDAYCEQLEKVASEAEGKAERAVAAVRADIHAALGSDPQKTTAVEAAKKMKAALDDGLSTSQRERLKWRQWASTIIGKSMDSDDEYRNSILEMITRPK